MTPSAPHRPATWRASLLHPSVWRRAMLLGMPIGVLQAVINQGDFWWRHDVDAVVIAKTIISPLVTFSVALISAAATHIDRQRATYPHTEKQTATSPLESKPYDRIEI